MTARQLIQKLKTFPPDRRVHTPFFGSVAEMENGGVELGSTEIESVDYQKITLLTPRATEISVIMLR